MNCVYGKQLLSVLAMSLSASVGAASTGTLAPDVALRADLQRMATQRIYFGHQSVGGDLLDGIQQIAVVESYPLRIEEYATANTVPAQTLGHTRVGENGKPFGKLQAFAGALGPTPSGVNIALLKFCYADFTPYTDAKALFSKYKVAMDEIKFHHPGLTLVHVTVPLTAVQSGLKAAVKAWLGKSPYGILENKRREEFNALVRKNYFGREHVFDLAKIESTTQSGSRTTVEWMGDSIPTLNPTYTDDGSHLNTEGRIQAARQLISVLARIP